MTHSLYCSLCSTHFPVYLYEFCSFHPQDPEFATLQFKSSTQPFGKYPCCGASLYRYNPVAQNHQRGCQSRDHKVKLKSDSDASIYRILMAYRDAMCLVPVKKSGGIKIGGGDGSSITLPKPFGTQPCEQIEVETADYCRQQDFLVPKSSLRRREGLISMGSWEVMRGPSQHQPPPTPTPQQTAQIKKSNTHQTEYFFSTEI